MSDVLTHVVDDLVRASAEREEYMLYGAWRAGYDYVHVHNPTAPMHTDGGGEYVTVSRKLIPSNAPKPHRPAGYVYAFTYDLTDLSVGEVRAVMDGD